MKTINTIIWGVITVVFLSITILHPRIYFGLIFLFSVTQFISLAFPRKPLGRNILWKRTIPGIVCIYIIWFTCQFFNIFFPYHAVYEYKNDIQNLKSQSPEKYSHFPDALPDTATDIKWVCFPSFMQGSGYDALFFYADNSYIEGVYNMHVTSSTIYTYENYEWRNNDVKKDVYFPRINDISEQDRENVSVLVTVDNDDRNHPHISGLYVNKVDGYVCYFAQ